MKNIYWIALTCLCLVGCIQGAPSSPNQEPFTPPPHCPHCISQNEADEVANYIDETLRLLGMEYLHDYLEIVMVNNLDDMGSQTCISMGSAIEPCCPDEVMELDGEQVGWRDIMNIGQERHMSSRNLLKVEHLTLKVNAFSLARAAMQANAFLKGHIPRDIDDGFLADMEVPRTFIESTDIYQRTIRATEHMRTFDSSWCSDLPIHSH